MSCNKLSTHVNLGPIKLMGCRDVQGQEFYEGVGVTMRGGLLPFVQCRSVDRTGEQMRT